MDPSRRELYVEGSRDRLFLAWLLAGAGISASVLEIAWVDLPSRILGGERGRLIHFATYLGDRDIEIRMFADADFDRLLARAVPNRVWLTDHRDMEGYFLRKECIDKALQLGIATERVSAVELLATVQRHGRCLGLVRIMSEIDGLSLPFQATRLRRYLHFERGQIELDFDEYLQTLAQNAGISLTGLDQLRERLSELAVRFASAPDSEVIHGKDALCIIEVALSKFGVAQGEAARLVCTSFEAHFIERGSTLEAVVRYLRG